ncbi:type II toxin-antitoxin system Phd/YefM family antitoxin [Polynucleobacter corsicus]|uniref:type II toxin-antitoxin system Phd/YefM family antitoxin n=1 Tax=Polynucleobacter corsicus TaxID=2081042 RepID=UPI001BFDE41D|nr:type II toxin-antitoxin system prevent-host-death family antitoxin [Polynucleobacter corsicus]QWE18789.1 type II toxin-antitoxin system prevent-host-death family antitoxin [Polynucleobacter corsicus]
MKSAPISIDVFEVKVRLAELFRKVSDGQVVRITRRGKPIADLAPITNDKVESIAIAAKKMLTLMKGASAQTEIDIRPLINAGRDT